MLANTAENGALYYEASQAVTAMTALTDSGDHQLYTSAVTLWSERSGYSPVVRPDGMISGGVVIVEAAGPDNDEVDVSAGTCYLIGVPTSVPAVSGAGSLTCVRSDVADPCIITSIIVTAAGAFDVLQGTKGGALTTTRGVAGGPPLLTVGVVEVAQVKYTSHTPAAVTAAEIFQVPGVSQERYDYPLWEVHNGRNQAGDIPGGCIKLLAAIGADHVGPVTKAIYASYSEPAFAENRPVSDFVPPTNAHSVSSKQVYSSVIGSRSSSLNQGSFTAFLSNGVNDPLMRLKDEILWFKFYPDRYKSPYVLSQGKLGVVPSYPADDSITAACTLSAAEAAVNVDA